MAIATAAQGAIGIAEGAAKFFEGRKMQQQANKLIDNFKWDTLENAYKDNTVSTLGADLQREENARSVATTTDALRSGGNRAIVGGLGRVMASSNTMNKQIGADLDAQQKTIDMAKSQDDARIRDMQEKRQTDELAGYGSMLNAGMGLKNQGMSDAINAVGVLGQGLTGLKGGWKADAPPKDGMENITALAGGGFNSNIIQNIPSIGGIK